MANLSRLTARFNSLKRCHTECEVNFVQPFSVLIQRVGCPRRTKDERMITPDQFQALLPLACAWAEEQEGHILREGVPLSAGQIVDAKRIGLAYPERVRLRVVDEIPLPENPALRAAAEATALISPLTAGLTLRYGIFIQSDYWCHRRLVVHELAHVAQYERLGGFRPFLQQYLFECLTIGYPEAPLEQEAKNIENRFCG